MADEKKAADKNALSLRRLDYRIKATKAALSPDRVYTSHMRNRGKPFTTYDEFGLSANKMPIVTHYLWLLSKLGVLCGIKLWRILFIRA